MRGIPLISRGFSALELAVVLAIVGILLALAIPSYQRYVQRGQRVEATRLLMAAAACQERVRAATGYYDTSACLPGFRNETYEIRTEPPGVKESLQFTLVAEPRRHRASDRCGSLRLDQAGTRGIDGAPDALAACWSGR